MALNLLLFVETTLILSVAALYIIHCPFNKVEESFNTQAVHDIVNIFPDNLPLIGRHAQDKPGQEIAVRSKLSWDHTEFPGVVPRSFIGAILVGFPLKLAKCLMLNDKIISEENDEDDGPDLPTQFILQIGSRFALCCYVVFSLSFITRALQKRFGLSFRIAYLMITISQFHYMFYAGRFIPNTFATILANLVFASWINRLYSKSIIYMAVCAVIFRFDTALFFAVLLLDAIFVRRFLPLLKVLKIGIPAGIASIMLTFAIDSVFWGRPIWPEFEGFYFNVWLNKSSEWGTQPFSWYIYSCMPRMMMCSAPLILVADHKVTREYLIPSLTFIMLLSFLPHKELRFILFLCPFLNVCATSGLMNIYHYLNTAILSFTSNSRRNVNEKPQRSYIAVLIFSLITLGILILNLFGCTISARVSSHNYPGGHASLALGMTKELLDTAQKSLETNQGLQYSGSEVAVFLNNLAAQTGASRFVQVNGAYYSKAPKLDASTFQKPYNLLYLVLEPPEVLSFVRDHCRPGENQSRVLDQWQSDNSEIKCTVPNQSPMFCSIIDSIKSLRFADLRHLITYLMRTPSISGVVDSIDKSRFIKTQTALNILRCSKTSKFNPF